VPVSVVSVLVSLVDVEVELDLLEVVRVVDEIAGSSCMEKTPRVL
jgi:hypothetical protein